jgi:selenocysteine-specific elongation factor
MTGPLALAVIGHVNHGKTALVRALTGIETDRLKEEKDRGLSITLGFAWRGYGDRVIDFIDTPGHEDFIRAMVAGAAGAAAVMLVVSAAEGFARGTAELLQIAALLGVEAGLVAVTKADLLAPGEAAAARAAVAARLAGGFLAGAPILFCSARSGQGLDALHQALEALARCAGGAEPLAGAFMPIDRAFTRPGAGTVVTGALRGGALRPDDEAVLQPSGRAVTLREIQVHGAPVAAAWPGGRVAALLRGVPADAVKAGDVLCAPGAFAPATAVDALIGLPPDAPRPLRHMDAPWVMWGARRDMASVRLIGAKAIEPGQRGFARLRFSAPVIAYPGQRAVLRRPSPAETVGGALILDPVAAPIRGKSAPRLAVLEAALAGDVDGIAERLAEAGGGLVSVAEVARLARRREAEVKGRLAPRFGALDADRLASMEAVAAAREAYLDALAAAHRETPARAAISVGQVRAALARLAAREVIARAERDLAADGAIRLAGNLVALPSHDPFAALSPEALARLGQIERGLRDGGASPPDAARLTGPAGLEGADPPLLDLLIESGRAVRLRNVALRQSLVFHRDALAAARAALDAAFPDQTAFATGEARAALGTSRKFIVPLLEHFDALGWTLREGDLRRLVPGAGEP